MRLFRGTWLFWRPYLGGAWLRAGWAPKSRNSAKISGHTWATSSGPDSKLIKALKKFAPPLKGSVWSKNSFPFFAENMIIRSILNLWWHSEILKLILGVVRGMFTKRLKRTRRLLYTVKSDFFEMTAFNSKC